MKDPAHMTQEELMNLMEHMLVCGRQHHANGTRERAAYDASLGLLVKSRPPWWRRWIGAWLYRRGMKGLRRTDRQPIQITPPSEEKP